MKLQLLLTIALAAPVLGGQAADVSSTQVIVAAEPGGWNGFAAGSVGDLFEFDEPMYHLQVGADTPWQVAGGVVWRAWLHGEGGGIQVGVEQPSR